MSVWAICMCKDEADIIEATVSRMLEQVDRVLVADNGSTDGTREILEGLPVLVLDDPDPAYYQSVKTSALAQRAAGMGADWVIPFDADEVWKCRRGHLRDALGSVPTEVDIVTADLYDHVPTAVDSGNGDPTSRIRYRRANPGALPKVACRVRPSLVIEQGNHGAHYDEAAIPLRLGGLIGIRHFPYRSVEQMIRKARNGSAAYAATDLPEDAGAHWRGYGRLTDEQIGDVFREYFWSADPVVDGLVCDPA